MDERNPADAHAQQSRLELIEAPAGPAGGEQAQDADRLVPRLVGRNRAEWGHVMAACAVILLATLPSMQITRGSPSCDKESFKSNSSDALVFRVVAELLTEGRTPYDLSVQQEHIARTRLEGHPPPYTLPFAYPPHALPLFMIYLLGPPRAGYALFVFLGLVMMLAAAWWLTARWIPDIRIRGAAVLAVGVSGPALFNTEIGQTGTYLAAMVFAYVAAYARRPLVAGIALGLMTFKPQYALPLGVVALADRQWRMLLAATATGLACAIVSGLLFGFYLWGDFLGAVLQENHTAEYMSNWFAVCFPLGAGEFAQRLALPVMLSGCLIVWGYCGRPSSHPDRWIRNLGFAIGLAPLVSANTHPYDLSIIVVTILAILSRTPQTVRLVGVLFFCVVTSCMLWSGDRWMYPILLVVMLMALQWSWRSCRRIVRQEGREAEAGAGSEAAKAVLTGTR